MLDNGLLEIIKLKDFKNVWSLLQYLNDIGCEEDEMLSIVQTNFTQLEHFKDVAYGRIDGITKGDFEDSAIDTVEWVMFIGLIDASNHNLRAMFDAYKKGVIEGNIDDTINKDMEKLCNERYVFRNLSDKTLDYFRDVAIKHYGGPLL